MNLYVNEEKIFRKCEHKCLVKPCVLLHQAKETKKKIEKKKDKKTTKKTKKQKQNKPMCWEFLHTPNIFC